MPSFGKRSLRILDTCHPDIQMIMNEIIKVTDITIISGHRGEAEQTAIYNGGHSKTAWPKSKHNNQPSHAVDIAPYPIDWSDAERFIYVAGMVIFCARYHNIKMRWGGDWSMDDMQTKNKFKDWGHFELRI